MKMPGVSKNQTTRGEKERSQSISQLEMKR